MPTTMPIKPAQLGIVGGANFQPLTISNLGWVPSNTHVPVGMLAPWFRASVVTGRTLAALPSDWRICDGSVCVDAGPTAPTLPVAVLSGTTSAGAPGPVTAGTHVIAISFVDQFGYESALSPSTATVTASASKNIDVSSIQTGPANISGRWIYMSKAGTSSPLFQAKFIPDNFTTSAIGANGVNISDTNMTVQSGPGGGPWNTLALPNLVSQFPRGHHTLTNANFAADSGYRTGGANLFTGGADAPNFSHSHSYNVSNGNHTHSISGTHTHNVTGSIDFQNQGNGPGTHTGGSLSNPSIAIIQSNSFSPFDHNHSFFGGSAAGAAPGPTDGGGSFNINGSTNNSLGAVTTTPPYNEFVWIMKIR